MVGFLCMLKLIKNLSSDMFWVFFFHFSLILVTLSIRSQNLMEKIDCLGDIFLC